MQSAYAQRVIESLRKGIPPNGNIRHFTVGRKSEIERLLRGLADNGSGATLLQANYGSGKSHLLRFLREHALESDYAVSLLSLDARSAVRFNRMDQILGAVCRNIEVPRAHGDKGVRPFFDQVCDQIEAHKSASGNSTFWRQLTNEGKWDYSEVLDAPAMYIALRAWATGDRQAQDLVDDWFRQPWTYTSQRRHLYNELVGRMRLRFRDPRGDWQFYADGVFVFNVQGYSQSWAALRDLNRLARESGLRGLIILFDEFEDIITNLNNIAHQQAAFWNLFQFYSGKSFPGMTYFAVTPEFTEKCEMRLWEKGRYDYDYNTFKAIPTFQMSPLTEDELEELALRIMETHGQAYNWEPDLTMKASDLDAIVRKAASVQIQDRARHTITTVVRTLDRLLEDSE